MSDLKVRFDSAAAQAQKLPGRPDNATLLQLYALYKQATVGDVNIRRPGGFDFKEQAKWDAWSKLKGKSSDTAMQAYIDLVEKLKKG